MEAYVLDITVLRSKQLNLKVCPADGIDRDTALPFSEAEFAPGKYLVEGPARKCPPGPLTLAELAQWFGRLDGSWGKEIGNGMKRYTVRRLPG